MVPREMPPLPDRRSVHYPGFDVHRDTHIALPCTRSMTRAREEAARVQEGEVAKENVRPMAGTVPCKSGKVKGDVTRARRHPLGNVWEFKDQMHTLHVPPEAICWLLWRCVLRQRAADPGAITLDVRGRDHRWSALYGNIYDPHNLFKSYYAASWDKKSSTLLHVDTPDDRDRNADELEI
ncbi:hypothetical protein EI94DRAFT_1704845 [Lactarius quietus]|nr:hypothetical protein EI94DRAFT_1704845 [Lactarius quietus]